MIVEEVRKCLVDTTQSSVDQIRTNSVPSQTPSPVTVGSTQTANADSSPGVIITANGLGSEPADTQINIYTPYLPHPNPASQPSASASLNQLSSINRSTFNSPDPSQSCSISDSQVQTKPDPSSSRQGTDCSSLNRSDWNDIRPNHHLLSFSQLRQLDAVEKKVEYYPQRFESPSYLPTASMLILSDYGGASKLSMCCIPNAANRSGLCKQINYCPYCMYLRRQTALQTFVPNFHLGSWYFVTLSFSGALPFDTGTAHDLIDYWDAAKRALACLQQDGRIDGYCFVEETAVLSFLPLRVMPHIHALVSADSFGAQDVECLVNSVNSYVGKSGSPLALPLSPDVKFITSELDMLYKVSYLFKNIDLVSPYQRAWNALGGEGAWQLNSELKEFTTGLREVKKYRKTMGCSGVMHPGHSEYLGTRKRDRRAYQDYITELRASGAPAGPE